MARKPTPAGTPDQPTDTAQAQQPRQYRGQGMSYNKATLIGRLTRDPQLRYTPNGTPVCEFGLATNRFDGTADFHNIKVWDKQALSASELLSKGRLVLIEGSLETRSWPDKETGKPVYRTEIVGKWQRMDSAPATGGGDEPSPADVDAQPVEDDEVMPLAA